MNKKTNVIKPLILAFVIAFVVVGAAHITNLPKPLEDVDISKYEVALEGENYIIYKALRFDLDGVNLSRSEFSDKDREHCTVNDMDNKNHVVYYKGKYYSIIGIAPKRILTCDELRSIGVD